MDHLNLYPNHRTWFWWDSVGWPLHVAGICVSAELDISADFELYQIDITLKKRNTLVLGQSILGSVSFLEQWEAVMETSARPLMWLRSGEHDQQFPPYCCWEMPFPLHIPPVYSPCCSGGCQALHSPSTCGAQEPEMSSVTLRNRVFGALWPNLTYQIKLDLGGWTAPVSHIIV